MPRKLAVCLLLLALIPFSASAAGLGKIKVKSGLGEPLDAEIELLENPGEESASLKATVASADEYASSGLPDAYIPQGIHIQIIRHADNSRVLHLVSDRPVNEPFLELLIKAESSTTNLLRQYTLLLDPPVSRFRDEPEKQVKTVARAKPDGMASQALPAAAAGQPDEAIPEFIPRKSRKSSKHKTKKLPPVAYDAEATKPVTGRAEGSVETYTTQSGDVFGKVAQRYQPEGVSLKKVMAAFFAANPDAFVDGDINQLKADQTLRVPAQDAMKGGQSEAKPGESKQPEKPAANLETQPQPAKEASPKKFVLKISPGDTDASANEKPAVADQPALPADANAANANSATGQTPANVQAAPAEQVPPVDAAVTAQQPGPNAEAPVKPEAPPVAPAEVNKPLSASASAEDKSMLDAFLVNLPWIAFGMAIPLLFFLVMYIMHRRRLAEVQNLQDYVYEEEDAEFINPENDLGETLAHEPAIHRAPAPVDNSAPLFNPTEVRHDAEMDIHEVDPLVEAEIYMSYGRDEQAESILSNALVKTPYKHELSLGLLKIYADRSDTDAFERVAHTVYEAAELGTLEDVVIWGKAAILGLKIDPQNPLYQIEGVTQEVKIDDNQSAGNTKEDQLTIEEFPEDKAIVDYDLELPEEPSEFPELPPLEVGEMAAAEPLELPDLELPEDIQAAKPEQDLQSVKSLDKSNVLEFTLDDFMRPTLDETTEKPGSSDDEQVGKDALFPAQKNAPKKK